MGNLRLTALSGNVFAVALREAVIPAFPPAPAIYPQRKRRHIVRVDMVSADVGIPALKMFRMPE